MHPLSKHSFHRCIHIHMSLVLATVALLEVSILNCNCYITITHLMQCKPSPNIPLYTIPFTMSSSPITISFKFAIMCDAFLH